MSESDKVVLKKHLFKKSILTAKQLDECVIKDLNDPAVAQRPEGVLISNDAQYLLNANKPEWCGVFLRTKGPFQSKNIASIVSGLNN